MAVFLQFCVCANSRERIYKTRSVSRCWVTDAYFTRTCVQKWLSDMFPESAVNDRKPVWAEMS